MTDKYAFVATQDAAARIDRESGLMTGLAVITEGEAKGHGVMVDEMSLQTVVDAIGNEPQRAYITHSGALFNDRLTREIGLFKNFRVDDDKVRADFEAFESFREDDKRKYNRLFEMAEKAPSKMGLSIVFGGTRVWATMNGDMPYGYGKEQPPEGARFEMPSMRVKENYSVDFVDDPAANNGLFSAKIDNQTNSIMTKQELETKLSEVDAEKAQLTERIEQLGTEKELIEGEVAAMSAKVEELEKTLAAEKEQAEAKAAEQAETYASEKAAIEAELAAAKARIAELEELSKGSEPVGGQPEGEDEPRRFTAKERDQAIKDYAKEHGISEFSATIKLGKERPELWGK